MAMVVARDSECHAQSDRCIHQTICMQSTVIGAVGECRDGRPHGGLAAQLNLVRQFLQIGEFRLGHQLEKPILYQIQRDDLRPEVTHRLVGSAHILADQRHQRLVGLAGAQQLHRGNLQSFFEHFSRLGAAKSCRRYPAHAR